MLALLIGIAIGLVIGWNTRQPDFARDAQARLRDLLGSDKNRLDR